MLMILLLHFLHDSSQCEPAHSLSVGTRTLTISLKAGDMIYNHILSCSEGTLGCSCWQNHKTIVRARLFVPIEK